MTHQSERPYGPLFAKYELRVEAVTTDDRDVEALAEALDKLDVEESLAAVARRIEDALPRVRVEIR